MTKKLQLREYLLQEQATGLALRLYNKFVKDGSNITPDEVTSLVNRFRQIQNQNQLHSRYGAVVSFDYKFPNFRGDKNDKEFELSLRNIENYTLPELKFLINQFSAGHDENNEVINDTELILSSHSSPTLIKRSFDQFWNGKYSIVIDLGDLRVYEVLNQEHSIAFGWYLKYIQSLDNRTTSHQWCTTTPLSQGNSNQYGYYRGNGGTFYYVIDDTKGDKINPDGSRELSPANTRKWYLSAIQVLDKRRKHEDIQLTDIHDTNTFMSWDGLFQIHPRLAPYKDKLKYREYSEDELSDSAKAKSINEQAGSKYEFAIQEKKRKRDFILTNEPLNSLRSWRSMTDDLKKLYIETSYVNNYSIQMNINKIINKFRNPEFIQDIRGTSLEKTLERFIITRYEKPGIKWILNEIFFSKNNGRRRYELSRKCIGRNKVFNPADGQILLKNTESTSKVTYGIYDLGKAYWASSNGITFDDGYVLSRDVKDTRVVVMPNNDEFTIFKYKKSNDDYFVVLTNENTFGNIYDGYFYFKTEWENKILPIINNLQSFDDIDAKIDNNNPSPQDQENPQSDTETENQPSETEMTTV